MPELAQKLNDGNALSDEDKEQLKNKFIEFKATL